ncbi:energy-coupled thiamine transporter ThiT [Lactococcus fujiensis]|uniref:Thiamine transporter ThiT n=1 Tax=Lactococcus fujiensis JCM 16395 TaxID=1291764 RepID=A0A2A5RMW4_9LACT|nr:energy-coupled thiamine transporter ThiT [Lactococcus fujiensis]PCS00664.1 thiamine transporter ThiT [Lactococcus fujiensis JCM 16395]
MSQSKVLPLAETAIFVALALILSLFSINYAQTFYLELTVIPLLLLAIRRGLIWGLIAGLLYGLLAIVLGEVTPLSFAQGFLEYIIAPISLGLAGLFNTKSSNKFRIVVCATLLGVFVKYFFHFIAGIVFWGQYAWKGWSVWLYSLVTQGISGLITAIAALIILGILYKAAPKLFIAK